MNTEPLQDPWGKEPKRLHIERANGKKLLVAEHYVGWCLRLTGGVPSAYTLYSGDVRDSLPPQERFGTRASKRLLAGWRLHETAYNAEKAALDVKYKQLRKNIVEHGTYPI